MDVEVWIKKNKELNAAILSFLESESDSEDEFRELAKIIDDQEIVKNKKSALDTFQLLYIIGDNHHRTTDFIDRLGRIFDYLTKQQLPIKNAEILDLYKRNKRLLLLLFEHKVIIPDESIVKYLIENDDSNDKKLNCYLFSEIKNYLDEEMKANIENKITEEFKESIEAFESKIKIGENDSPICKMIREDSIQEFIAFISRTNLPIKSTIKTDFYESNTFLIDNESSLIEYACFYGSIQVIKYLLNKNVDFTHKCWLYGIHSQNPEIIELLEENEIEIDEESVIESIKCHHNDFSNYIIDKLTERSKNKNFYDVLNQSIIKFCNYYYLPDDIINLISKPEKEKFKMRYLPSSFNNITIPNSVKTIGSYAFNECSSLIQITIPSSVTSIGWNAFNVCSSLTQISIPSSVTKIGWNAFYKCSSLVQISIPSSVTKIGDGAFKECKSLTQISISSSLTSIGYCTFEGCSSLAQITIPSFVTSIGNGAFKKCSSLTEISIPSSVTKIGDGVFEECSSLTQISIPSSVTSFGTNIFNGVKSLQITGNIKYIPDNLFKGCHSLIKITIPSSITKIGVCAFKKCLSLTQISIPSSVTLISKFALSNCKCLKEVEFAPDSKLQIIDDCSFQYSAIEKITIPSNVTSIGSQAFYNCVNLQTVDFENNSQLTTIKKEAFSESSIQSIKIPSNVSLISESAFLNCNNLQVIEISEGSKLPSLPSFPNPRNFKVIIPPSLK